MSVGITLPDTPLYRMLRQRVRDRQDASPYLYDRLPGEMWPYEWIELHKPKGVVHVGTQSLTVVDEGIKYLRQWPCGYGDIAAEYLRWIAGDENKLRRHNGAASAIPAPPLYFTGPRYDHCAYVDIVGCYFHLYRPLSLDCVYKSPTGSASGQIWYRQGSLLFECADELALSKQVRNTVYGIMRKRVQVVYRDGKYEWQSARTPLYRYCLTQLVMETLQAVAQSCIDRFSVHMWLTDAAILPRNQAQALIDFLRLEWRLDSRIIAQGQSRLLALGRYTVGSKWSANLDGNPIPVKRDSLPDVPSEYLQQLRMELTGGI